jgi:hypothetical protein
MENWKKIQGFEDYSVSDMGRVRRDIGGSGRTEGRILKPKSKNGYLSVVLYSKNGKKTERIHRLVAQAFIPNTHNKNVVNHKNANKSQNDVGNLEWNTDSENILHVYQNHLRSAAGEKNGRSKLTEFQILEIRRLKSEGYKYKELQEKFQVSLGRLSLIVNRKTWAHI